MTQIEAMNHLFKQFGKFLIGFKWIFIFSLILVYFYVPFPFSMIKTTPMSTFFCALFAWFFATAVHMWVLFDSYHFLIDIYYDKFAGQLYAIQLFRSGELAEKPTGGYDLKRFWLLRSLLWIVNKLYSKKIIEGKLRNHD